MIEFAVYVVLLAALLTGIFYFSEQKCKKCGSRSTFETEEMVLTSEIGQIQHFQNCRMLICRACGQSDPVTYSDRYQTTMDTW
jgi:predicted nucleic-acid-binding Zn-ribbon protein